MRRRLASVALVVALLGAVTGGGAVLVVVWRRAHRPRLTIPTGGASFLLFLENERSLALFHQGATFDVDLRRGERLWTKQLPAGRLRRVALSSKEREVAVLLDTSGVVLLDARTGDVTATLPVENAATTLQTLRVLPSGDVLLEGLGVEDTFVVPRDGTARRAFAVDGVPRTLDGQGDVVGELGGRVTLTPTDPRRAARSFALTPGESPTIFTTDFGEALITTRADGQLGVVSLETGRLRRTLDPRGFQQARASRSGDLVALGFPDRVEIWDVPP